MPVFVVDGTDGFVFQSDIPYRNAVALLSHEFYGVRPVFLYGTHNLPPEVPVDEEIVAFRGAESGMPLQGFFLFAPASSSHGNPFLNVYNCISELVNIHFFAVLDIFLFFLDFPDFLLDFR